MGSILSEYIGRHADQPFDWASNNCMTFVSGYLDAIGYPPLPRKWCYGYTDAREAVRAYRQCLNDYGHESVIYAMDHRFDRTVTLHPDDGMICARRENGPMGYAFGLTCNQQCVFLTDDGARIFHVEAGDMFWDIQ